MYTGIALVTGMEDRQWLYPAMTRGTDTNLAFVFTTPPRSACRSRPPGPLPSSTGTTGPGTSTTDTRPAYPAPPARAARTCASRSPCSLTSSAATAPSYPPPRPGGAPWPTPTTWASSTRSGPPRPPAPATTATATWCWPRYHPATGGTCPPKARWLFRTLRGAELAGLDPAEVIRAAIASRDLAGARDIAAVLDARIRSRVDPLLPQPQGPWASRIPRLPDPARQAYLGCDLAASYA